MYLFPEQGFIFQKQTGRKCIKRNQEVLLFAQIRIPLANSKALRIINQGIPSG